MTITEVHMNSMGIVHGGSISTLADTSVGFGAFINKPEKV
jgi:acyl-coenzyme A thioesterase PaaI-like protein